MRKDAWACCATAGIGAAFGLFARWLQQINIFEEGTGLAAPGAFSSRMYVLVCLLSAGLLAYRLLRVRQRMVAPSDRMELMTDGRLFPVLMGVSGALAAVGSALIFFLQTDRDVLTAILALLGLLMALGLVFYPAALRHAERLCVLCAAPVAFSGFWFIMVYKENVSDPVLWHYAPLIVAVAAVMLAYFYMAGFAFCQPRPLRAAFSAFFASILCMTVLPDGRPAGEVLILLAFILSLSTLGWHTLSSLSERRDP